MSRQSAVLLDTHGTTCQVEVIVDDYHFAGTDSQFHTRKAFAAAIHEHLWLYQQDVLTAHHRVSGAINRATIQLHAPASRQLVDNEKSDIVACSLVLRTWVPEADNNAHSRLRSRDLLFFRLHAFRGRNNCTLGGGLGALHLFNGWRQYRHHGEVGLE